MRYITSIGNPVRNKISSNGLIIQSTNHHMTKVPPNEFPGYDTKQSDGEIPAVLELWGMRSTPSLPSLPGPLWPGVVVPDRSLSMG